MSRPRWLGAHLLVSGVGSAVVLLAGALGLGLGYLLVTGDARDALRYAAACLPLLAPVLVLSTAAAALHGLARRAARCRVAAAPRLRAGRLLRRPVVDADVGAGALPVLAPRRLAGRAVRARAGAGRLGRRRRAGRPRAARPACGATSVSVRRMWQPDPDWDPLPGGTGPSTLGDLARRPRRRRPRRQAAGGPAGRGPARAGRPAAPGLLATRGRPGSPPGSLEHLPGLRAPAGGRRGGRRRRHRDLGVGRGGASPVRLSWRGRWPGSPRSPASGSAASRSRGTSCAAAWSAPAARGGWPTLARTSVGDVADHALARPRGLAGASRRAAAGRSCTATRPRPTCAAATARTSSPSTGAAWAPDPSAADLGYHALAARADLVRAASTRTARPAPSSCVPRRCCWARGSPRSTPR